MFQTQLYSNPTVGEGFQDDIQNVTLLSKTPDEGATGVSLSSVVKVSFDNSIQLSNTAVVSISSNGTVLNEIENFFIEAGKNLIIHHEKFSPNTEYTVNIDAGTIIGYETAISFTFTTGTEDIAPFPELISIQPNEGRAEVMIDAAVSATFSENILEASNGALSSIKIVDSEQNVVSNVTATINEIDNKVLNIAHSDFEYMKDYTVIIPSETLKGTDSETVNDTLFWSFSTISPPPVIISRSPDIGETNVAPDKTIYAGFDQSIYENDLTKVSLTDENGDTPPGFEVSISSIDLAINTSGLAYDTDYTISIPTGTVKNSGDLLNEESYSWSFKTVKPLQLISTSPENNETGVSVDSKISFVFNQPIDIVNAFNLLLYDSQGSYVPYNSVVVEDDSILVGYFSSFEPNSTYSVELEAGGVGNGFMGNDAHSFSFTTAGPIFEVVNTSPESGETGVETNGYITVEFSESFESVDYSFISVKDNEGGDIDWLDFGSSSTTLTIFHPELDPETEYTVTIGAEAIEELEQDYSFKFTTGEAPEPLAVSSTSPEAGKTGVSTDPEVRITFNQPVNLYNSQISVVDDQENYVYSNYSTIEDDSILVATFSNLDPFTTYTLEVQQSTVLNFEDEGNDYFSFSFTTREMSPPYVLQSYPEPYEHGLSINFNYGGIEFSGDVTILDEGKFKLKSDDGDIIGLSVYPGVAGKTVSTTSYYNEFVSFELNDNLQASQNYTFTIEEGAVETESGLINQEDSWSFTTYPNPRPRAVYTFPLDEGSNVASDSSLIALFNTEVELNDLSKISITDKDGGILEVTNAQVILPNSSSTAEKKNPTALESFEDEASADHADGGTNFTYESVLIIDHPNFSPNKEYTVEIGSGALTNISDGNTNHPYSWTFSTIETEIPNPVVESYTPEIGQEEVPIDTEISVTFDQPIEVNNLSDITISFGSEQLLSNISPSVSGNKLTIAHPDLEHDTEYYVNVPSGTVINESEIGNDFISWNFHTVEGFPPVVAELIPEDGSELVALDADIRVIFEDDINPIDLSSLLIEDGDGNSVSGVNASVEDNELLIQHDDFEHGSTYTINIPPNILESSTGVLNSEVAWSFRTLPAAPVVELITPDDGATSVSLDTPLEATFDKLVFEGDLSQVEITDDQNNTLNGIFVEINENRVIISGAELERGTTYTVSLGSGLVLNSGELSNDAFSWSFTTILSAPEVASTSPEDGQEAVAVDAPVSATFTLPIEAADLEAITITDENEQTVEDVSALVDGSELLIDHSDFEPGTSYIVSLGEGAVINADGVESPAYSWSFTTILSTPQITGVTPEDGQAGVAIQPVIEVEFDQSIELDNASQVQLMGPDQHVEDVDIETNSNTLTLSPPQLTNGDDYTVTIGTGAVTNSDGVPNEAFSWSFTTVLSAPEITSTSPEDGQTGVALDAPVVVVLNQPVEEAELDDVSITDGDGQVLNDISVLVDGSELLIDHPDFEPGTTYTVSFGEGVVENEDGVENEEISWSFTTILPAPTVVSLTPESSQTGVEVNPVIQVEFDLPVTLTDPAQIELAYPEGESIDDLEAEVNDNVLTIITPQLANGVVYNIVIGSGTVTNSDGIPNEALSWGFTTILSAPEVIATKPIQNALAASVEADISIRFNQPISEGDFSLVEFADASDNTVSGMELTIEDSTLLIQHSGLEHLTDYFIQVSSGAVMNSDEVVNEFFQYRFTTVTDISEEVTTTVNRDFGDASSPTNYRLIALPGNIKVPLPEVLGSNGGETWQAFWDTGTEEDFLIEYEESELFELKPGNGFWLISAAPFSYNENIPSVDLNELNQVEIPLHSGWNIISNPLDVDVGWDAVEEANEVEDLQPLWAFNESFESTSVFNSAKEGEAFYFFNETDIETLLIPYIEHSAEKETSPESAEISITTLVEDEVSSKSELILTKEMISSENAKQVISPPGGFEEASIRFLNNDTVNSKSRTTLAAALFSSYDNHGQSFDMVLNTTAGTPVTVAAENAEGSLTNGELLMLIDKNTGIAYDLSNQSSVEITPEKDTTELLFVVGTEQYLNNEHAGYLPDEITINQNYPNPFNPTTILSFSIPEKSVVDVAIYNLLGQKVATLINRTTLSAGAHKLRFDGAGYASGLYIVRYAMGNQYFNQKVLLIK